MAKLPSDKISTTMVANALGISNRNVGFLCSASTINFCSIPKPINLNSLNPTLAELKSKHGMIEDRAPETMPNGVGVLIYDRPKGRATSPYRLGDFREYDHNAPVPQIIPLAPIIVIPSFGDITDNTAGIALELENIDFLKKLAFNYGENVITYKIEELSHDPALHVLGDIVNTDIITEAKSKVTLVPQSLNREGIKTPNLDYYDNYMYVISTGLGNTPSTPIHPYRLHNLDHVKSITKRAIHDNCVSSIISVTREKGETADLFPVDVSDYRHATSTNYLDGNTSMMLLINLDFTLTQSQKDEFDFYWEDSGSPSDNVFRRIEIYSNNKDGTSHKVEIANVQFSGYEGLWTGTNYKFNNAVRAVLQLKNPVSMAVGSKLEIVYINGIKGQWYDWHDI